MTFAATGSVTQAASSTTVASFSLTTGGSGNLVCVETNNVSNGGHVSALSSSHVTWTTVGTYSGTNNGSGSLFIGKVTSATTATVTVTQSGGSPTFQSIACQEFTSTVGSWAVDVTGHIDTTGTNTYASLTPGFGAGELYFGGAVDNVNSVNGSTSGYTYLSADSNGNGGCFNPNCSSSAQAPVFGDSTQLVGMMMLVRETGASPAVAVILVPSPSWRTRFDPTRRLVLPLPQPQTSVTDLDTVKGFDGVGVAPDTVVPVPDTCHGTDAGETILATGGGAPPAPAQPSRTWLRQFRPQLKLQLPLYQPTDYLDQDASTSLDGGELITVLPVATLGPSDPGLAVPGLAVPGQPVLTPQESGHGTDGGESIFVLSAPAASFRPSKTWREQFGDPRDKAVIPVFVPAGSVNVSDTENSRSADDARVFPQAAILILPAVS